MAKQFYLIIDGIRAGTTALGRSGPGNNIPQSSRTEASFSNKVLSHIQGDRLGEG